MEKVLIKITLAGTDHGSYYFAVRPIVGEIIKFRDKEVKVIGVVHEPLTKTELDSGEAGPGVTILTEPLKPAQSTAVNAAPNSAASKRLAEQSRKLSSAMKPKPFAAR